MSKPKLALYWAASCGGCEIAVLEIKEKILDVANVFDIVLWPCVMDFKYEDLEKLGNKEIDLCLFNGAIRTSEHEHLAKLLRDKSKVMVAYGTCACEGGIPGLANEFDKESIFQRVYLETPSTYNPDKKFPIENYDMPEGKIHLPAFYDTVRSLKQTVQVEYFIPGCPPLEKTTWKALEAVIKGDLPPVGSFLGAGDKTVCEECPRKKEEKKIKGFYRSHLKIPEPEKCLLEQGIICAGPATRSGCEAACIKANLPCWGCYGPPPGVSDVGAKFMSALASVIDSDDEKEVNKILEGIVDPIGTFYRFGLASSILRRKKISQEKKE
ncbi:MAG: oxidoreductase [candidate division Zixibacteria bacterium]|nr:oxidoreductase [candidate division Zixibacteria bacterium]